MKKPESDHWNTTHGGSYSATYKRWQAMKDRCHNPNATGYKNYGGRGVIVCKRWRESFAAFLADMGEAPRGLTIERENNDGNYEPGNCVWATKARQNDNQRRTRRLTWQGETLTIRQWSLRLACSFEALAGRINQGWGAAAALSTPFENPMLVRAQRLGNLLLTHRGETKTTTEWSRITGLRRTTIRYRMDAGWPPEEVLRPDVTHASRAYRKP